MLDGFKALWGFFNDRQGEFLSVRFMAGVHALEASSDKVFRLNHK